LPRALVARVLNDLGLAAGAQFRLEDSLPLVGSMVAVITSIYDAEAYLALLVPEIAETSSGD